ncbi:MAG: permease-like cell division protein FtsX [Zoogloeaceae bacterium]|jgi:cell division transport system permease protein|nr:permease-like cell division protein FtsX [Zoogloeaceae bacterium]
MKTWLRQHLTALRRALRRLWRSPLNTFLSLLVIGIAMTLPAAGYVFLDNLKTLGHNATGAQQISLFMQPDLERATLQETIRQLEARLPDQWRFVPREEALERLKASEDMAEIVASLPQNPLPDAFIIEPLDARPEALETLRETLATLPGVSHAQLDSAWVKRFDAFLQLGRLAVNLLAAVFAVGLIAVTFNTIRLQVLAQADEIEVARLIGATDAFIRRPFYYSGLLQGALGGVVATLLLFSGLTVLKTPVAQLAALYGSLSGLAPWSLPLLPLIGAILGWLGAQLSVSLALRQGE